MEEQPKSSPAKQKPSGKPKPEEGLTRPVQATPENFGLLFAAVLHIQQTLGEQLGSTQNKTEQKTQEHIERMETIAILSKTNALVRYGSYLMVALAASMIYLLLEIHKLEVLIAGLRR